MDHQHINMAGYDRPRFKFSTSLLRGEEQGLMDKKYTSVQ